MIQSFNKDGKHYYCKIEQPNWSQWACNDNSLETWAKVNVPSHKLKRSDIIEAIQAVDCKDENDQ